MINFLKSFFVRFQITESPKVLGIDISKYNGDIDLNKARAAGAKFVIARCGGGYLNNGVPFTDDKWLINLEKLTAQENLPWGAYWYFIPNNVADQIDRLISLIQSSDYWIPIALDCEKWWTPTAAEIKASKIKRLTPKQAARLAIGPAVITPSQASDQLEKALILLDSANITTQLIYTRKSFWDVYYEPRPLFSKCDLWVAHWGVTNPAIPGGWSTYKLHQASGDGNGRGAEFGSGPAVGGDSDMDINYFNGSEEEFNYWLGTDLDEYPYMVKVANTLNTVIRKFPNSGDYQGVAIYGDLLGVYERQEAPDGAVWLRVGVDRWIKEGHTIKI